MDKKHNGDLVDGRPYTTQVSDGNGNLYSDSPLYLQSYASYDDGYGHQHSPLGKFSKVFEFNQINNTNGVFL